MRTPFVLFARTLLSPASFGTTLYLWGTLSRGQKVTYCKMLCYHRVHDKEYEYAIVPQCEGYRWRVNGRTGSSPTFARAWATLPGFLTCALKYRDSQRVRVPHTGTTLLYRLWLAEHIVARTASGKDAPDERLGAGETTLSSEMLGVSFLPKRG